jgi:hypothetical protein
LEVRAQDDKVIPEIERICAEHGPFEAAYILFANGGWAPMDEELCAAMWKDGNSESSMHQVSTDGKMSAALPSAERDTTIA